MTKIKTLAISCLLVFTCKQSHAVRTVMEGIQATNGAIYIATTSPSGYVQVGGSMTVQGSTFSVGGSGGFSVTAGSGTFAGNLGIGTTSPAYTLDVQAPSASIRAQSTTGTNAIRSLWTNNGGSCAAGMESSAGGGLFGSGGLSYACGVNHPGAYPVQFGTNDTVRMTILSGGNVGIGTTSPAAKLDVAGTSIIGVGGTPISIISTGTYTPVVTMVSNVTSTTTVVAGSWIRIGNFVTVNGSFEISATAAANTNWGVSLPLASDIAVTNDLEGWAIGLNVATWPGVCRGDVANNRADCYMVATAAAIGNNGYRFSFVYEIK